MPKATKVRTSETDPIEVGWLWDEAPRVGLTIAPGKRGESVFGAHWDRDLDADIARLLEHHGVGVLVCLLEAHELPMLGIEDLFVTSERHGVEVLRFPIRDVDVPREEEPVRELSAKILEAVGRGKNVVIHCRGGLGRSGTIGGCVLIDRGATAAEALAAVRNARGPQAPETEKQKDFVRAYARKR